VENIRAANSRHILAYQGQLMEKTYRGKPLAPRTLHVRLSQVKTFFRFLLKTGRIYHDPAAGIDLPKRGRTLPRGILNEKEILCLLTQPDIGTPLGIRDRAILELLYSCGLRSSELRQLQIVDVDVSERTVHVLGKGNKEAVVPFGREAQRALDHYLLFARPVLLRSYHGGRQKTEGKLEEEKGRAFLFLTKNGHRINAANLYHMLRRYAKAAGLAQKIGPHSLRHTCATHLLKHGADIRHIQKLLRHTDISTTEIYTRVAIEDLKEAQMKFHPREQPVAGGTDG
jgi:integrase/recombinase XerD